MATAQAGKSSRPRYGVKPGSQVPPKKAQAYGEFLDALAKRHDGKLDADIVVQAAQSPRSPIHGCFEWDDGTAAEEYRKEQARRLIRAIVIVDEQRPQVRAFHNVAIVDDPASEREFYYVPTRDVLADGDLLEQVLQEATSYLRWFRQKYAALKELGGVHREIDRVMRRKAGRGR